MIPSRQLSAPSTQPDGWHTTEFAGVELAIRGQRTAPSISAFVPIALLLAAREGGSIHVDAALTETQLARLNCEFSPFVADFFDGKECRISAAAIETGAIPPGQSALMFSAGVDSFYTLQKLGSLAITPDMLLNIHAGAHDDNISTWHRRLDNIRSVAATLDIPVETVETNFHCAYPEAHVKCHTIRNIAAAISLEGISSIYYSSAYKLSELAYDKAKKHALAYIDPVIMRSFLPSGFEAIYVGWEADRLEKTQAICNFPLAFDHLDVCTDQAYQADRSKTEPINCGRCNKCIRTQIEIEACGSLDRFAKVFGLDNWVRHRGKAIKTLARSTDPIDRNAVRLLHKDRTQTGFRRWFS
ncbi:hypothetical protein [Hyphomicrobium sp. ghe19]|uniref:hypothetical protein n=1 Tax=Hyphomicrobium sp. ghe19 TaxID=2682968 RepID=UPI001367544D|nr:hypothetical protein HYPP_01263 [Hyphomicrobium sp. ghe19]